MHNLDSASQPAETADESPDDARTPPPRIVLEAIARRLCLTAVYNRTAVRLAPHILYERHGALFVDAVTIERDGARPKEVKLGAFKLVGLSELALTSRGFLPLTSFDPRDARYAGGTLFAVGA